MVARGIPQVPLEPRDKACKLPGWEKQASTDEAVISVWEKGKPGRNYGSVAQAVPNGILILEVDSADVLKRMESETGQTVPSTLMVRSSPGRGHIYFRQTTATISTGNLSQAYVKNGDWSARVHNSYAVSPGSWHPTSGKQYEVINDAPIIECPDWLVSWMLSQKVEKKRTDTKTDVERNGRGLIDHGNIHGFMLSHAGRMRNAGLEVEEIESALLRIVHEECAPPIDDEKVKAMARSMANYPKGTATDLILSNTVPALLTQQPARTAAPTTDVSNWLSKFRSIGEMEEGDVEMVIDGVLQEGTCFIGANPGDGKTLIGLAFAKAISTGTPLFGMPQFPVKKLRTVIYLIPESRDRAFRKRCEAFQLPNDKMKFMARTISAGMPLELNDPYLVEAIRQTKAVVFLDTASRFMKGSDENAATQNRFLVNDVTTLLAAGAVTVVLIHHATKASKAKQEKMTLENMLRGSSDLGAMCDQAYGIRKDMNLYSNGAGPMEIDLVNLKDREQIGGLTSIRLAASYKKESSTFPASYVNEEGNFRVVSEVENMKRNDSILVGIVRREPMMPEKEIAARTGMSEYAVRKALNGQRWHRVQGGKGGASPWHHDNGMPCQYAKPLKPPADKAAKTAKPGLSDAVAYLKSELAGTEPDGAYVDEADIYLGADERHLSDAVISNAKKRLGVVVKDKQWSLPGPEVAEEETVAAK